MHLMIPFAGTVSEAGRQALQTLSLPHLQALLAGLTPGAALGSDEFSFNPPHEQALARTLGWGGADDAVGALADVALPFAAQQAIQLGLQAPLPADAAPGPASTAAQADAAWGLLTPVHLHVGTEQVSLTDPGALQLDETASRELLDIVRPLFETEGFTLHWAAPLQWLATHALFDGLATASLDRVCGRNVDRWLPDQRSARLIRRLQNEVQMLLYTHAVNDRREAAGLPTVNSFWLSACGRLPAHPSNNPAATPPAAAQMAPVQLDDRLRAPALAEDWAAWCEAWRALDAGPLQALRRQPGALQLTLCGERRAQAFMRQPQGLWQRLASTWRAPAVLPLLESL